MEFCIIIKLVTIKDLVAYIFIKLLKCSVTEEVNRVDRSEDLVG